MIAEIARKISEFEQFDYSASEAPKDGDLGAKRQALRHHDRTAAPAKFAADVWGEKFGRHVRKFEPAIGPQQTPPDSQQADREA